MNQRIGPSRTDRKTQPSAGPPRAGAVHLLSFDVEEYFQIEAAARCVAPAQWDSFDKRLPAAVDRILALLAEVDVRATFFVLGWVARQEPQLVRRIAQADHEIASHGTGHRMIRHMTPGRLREDLRDSRSLLEDLADRAVLGYRAPTFSITHQTAWALDVLVEAGFRYDSSIFPVHHDRYGVPDAPPGPHRAVGPGGGSILEIPPLTWRVLGTNVPVGGGGYLRLLPVRLLAHALRVAGRRRRPGMIYLHPWELDPDQPRLPLGRLATFRHRVGLRRTEAKLRRLLREFRFSDVRSRLDSLDQTTHHTYAYGHPPPP